MLTKNHSFFKNLSIFFLLWLSFFSVAYSSTLYFNPSALSLQLYCQTSNVYMLVEWGGTGYNIYQFDIVEQTKISYLNPVITSVVTNGFVQTAINSGFTLPAYGYNVLRMIGTHSPNTVNVTGITTWGRITIQNSWFSRTWIVMISWNSYVDQYPSAWNSATWFWILTIDFYLWPCASDSQSPTITATWWMQFHTNNYTWPQFNDKIYRLDLNDPWTLNFWFYSGFTSPWDPDRTWWTYYSTWNTVLNGSGVDFSKFKLEIGVENSSDSNTFTVVTLTGILNFTWGWVLTGSNSWVLFYPYWFTWNRWNRNYTWSIATWSLWPTSTLDPDTQIPSFGIEKEVLITWTVVDRANKTGTFVTHFNYGAIPWWSNLQSSISQPGCGPGGSTLIGVVTPTADSGAYIDKYNSGFYLRTFRVFLHDDRAGVDSWSIVVRITGYQNWNLTSIIYTGNVTSSANLALSGFVWTGPINVLTTRGVNENVTSISGSNRNYMVTINYTGKWDVETGINISINYKDLVARTGNAMTCYYYNSYNPYVNNWAGDIHLNRTPFASWARLSGFSIAFEDERAGINSWTIILTITWSTITPGTHNVQPVSIIFNSGASLFSMLSPPYTTHSGTTNGLLLDGQKYNYILTVTQANLDTQFSGYFAPEYPVTLTLSYKDFVGNIQTSTKQYVNTGNGSISYAWSASPNPFQTQTNTNTLTTPSMSLAILLRDYLNPLASINWGQAFPVSTYSSTSGNTQFTGFQFAFYDQWAGVDSGYNFVKIQGTRRWETVTYVFATTDSTGRNRSAWTSCNGTYCLTGTMSKIPFSGLEDDSFTGQHPTIQRSTGYKFDVSSGHKIYLDYGTYSWVTPLISSYTVLLSWADLRPGSANYSTFSSPSLSLPYLQCQFLDVCSHNQLTFVWAANLAAPVTRNPLTGDLSPNGDPFTGSVVGIVASWVSLNTGTITITCSASGGLLDSPITINFTGWNVNRYLTWSSSVSHPFIDLKVADGLFELTGAGNDVLIVR